MTVIRKEILFLICYHECFTSNENAIPFFNQILFVIDKRGDTIIHTTSTQIRCFTAIGENLR